MNMNVNAKQVGGTHYNSSYQHWDFVERNNIGYLEACATKYIVRHRKKNGKLDLEKAEHYIEKLISLAQHGKQCKNDPLNTEEIEKFIQANQLIHPEAILCRLLFKVWDYGNLISARFFIKELITYYEPFNGTE
jgi:hypothetical protein